MDLTIVPINVRILDKLFGHLSKLSSHLYFNGTAAGLDLVAFNSSRSQFTKLQLRPTFFTYFGVSSFQCRLRLSKLSQIFKLKSSVEKSLDCCYIQTRQVGAECTLEITFKSSHGVQTVHKLYYEPIEELFDLQPLEHPNMWKVSPKLISTWLTHFPSHSDVSIYTSIIGSGAHSLENNVGGLNSTEPILDNDDYDEFGDDDDLQIGFIKFKSMNISLDDQPTLTTELQLDTAEFDEFQSTQSTSFTTSLSDLKVILAMAESIGSPIEARYSMGGVPVEFVIQINNSFSVSCILATTPVIDEEDDEIPGTPPLPVS